MAIDKKLIFWKKQSTFNAPSSTTDTTGSVMWYSIVFFKDTGQIWTNGTYYNCGIWGTPQTNYVPLTIGGTSYNLSRDGHTHAYFNRYGPNAEVYDINSYFDGIRTGYQWVNAPLGGIGTLQSIVYSNDWISQEFTSIGSIPSKFIRCRHSGTTWGDWNLFWHSGNSNLSTVNWSAKNLALSGTLTGASIVYSGRFTSTNNGVLNHIYTTSPTGNAALTIEGGNYTHAIHFKDGYNTSDYALLSGGYITTAQLLLYKFSAQNTISNTSTYRADGATIEGNIISNSFVKSGGTAAQFLKADGSSDATTYLSLAGGTMTGPLNFKNGTWNNVGDDAAIGDINVAGQIGIKSLNTTNPGIAFYNSSNTAVGNLVSNAGTLQWSNNTVLHTGNYSSYALPLSGGVMTGPIIKSNEILNLAQYHIGTGTVTGMIDIVLPNTNWMGDLYISIQDYVTGKGGVLRCQIYTYYGNSTGFAGANSVSWTGGTPTFSQVRYVTVGSDNNAVRHILIGTSSTQWNYSSIWLSKAVQNPSFASWSTSVLPTVSFLTADPTIFVTSLNVTDFYTYKADLANSATNATNASNSDTVDSLHAASFMRSDTDTFTTGANLMVGSSSVANPTISIGSGNSTGTLSLKFRSTGLEGWLEYIQNSGLLSFKNSSGGFIGIQANYLTLGGALSGATTGSFSSHVKIGGGTANLSSPWDGGLIAGNDGHDKIVATYLASSTNAATIGAHNTGLSAWAKLNVAGTSIQFSINETPKMILDSGGNLGLSGQFTASGAIISNSAALGASTPFAITNSRIQSYASVWICADTDNSTGEGVFISASKGVSTNPNDGLAIYNNTVNFLGNNIWHAGNDSKFIYGDNNTGTSVISEDVLNNYLKSGFYTVSKTDNTKLPSGATTVNFLNHTAYSSYGNLAGIDILSFDSLTSPLYFRSSTGGGKGTWQKIWTDSNFTPSNYVSINSSRWVNFGYSNFALADKDLLENGEGLIKLDGWYNISIGASGNYGTRLTVLGQSAHDKTQLYFNGGNGSIQYRKSWYNNTAWTELRTILDSNNFNSYSLPLTGGTITGSISVSGSITNLSNTGGGIFWNPYAESVSDGSDVASISVATSGGSTVMSIKQMNDANDYINFLVNSNTNGVRINGNAIYHAGNIPTWNQNTTGNAATATSASAVSLHAGNEVNIGGGLASGRLYVNYNDGGGFTEYGFYGGGTSLINIYANTFYGTLSGNATSATGLVTNYIGGQQLNPQTYFNQGIGLKVAMTGAAGVWTDTLWINGYAGGDVLNMCALHTSRQGTPRMWITSQNSNSTTYGTLYEFVSTYNYSSLLDGRYRPMGGSWAGNGVPGTREFGFVTNDASGEIAFKSYNGTMNMIIDGEIYCTDSSHKVWHAGNDGAGSGLDADLLDGKHNGEITAAYFAPKMLSSANTLDNISDGVWFYVNGNNPTNSVGDNSALLQIGSRWWDIFQLAFPGNNSNSLHFRSSKYESGSSRNWNSWKTIAFTDSNVASATKLANTRTIWGQNFNGEGNVDGIFRSLVDPSVSGTPVFKILRYPSSPYGLVMRGYDSGEFSLQSQRETTSSEYFSLSINPLGGNVGIGTTSPSYKLDVNGTGKFAGKLMLDAAEGLGVYGIRGRTANEQVEMYQKVSIGSPNGWGGFPQAPVFGLSVYGGANFCTNQGNVLIGTTTDAGYKLDVNGVARATRFVSGYDSGYAGSVSCSNWFRSNGASGWYNESYGGGIHMTDSTWIRTYAGKGFYCDSENRGYKVSSITGFYKDGSSDSYVLLGGGGHATVSSLNVYNSTKSNSLNITGYGSDNLTYYQSSGDFDGNSGWSHYIIANHGDGSSYYHYTIALPFWSAPMYRRQTGSTANVTSWYTFISTENYTNYVVPKSGGTMTGELIANVGLRAGAINSDNTNFSGISLRADQSSLNPLTGIMYAKTSDKGTHGAVTGNGAVYFTIDDTTNRGWIFRQNWPGAEANVASISNTGNMTLNGYLKVAGGDDVVGIKNNWSNTEMYFGTQLKYKGLGGISEYVITSRLYNVNPISPTLSTYNKIPMVIWHGRIQISSTAVYTASQQVGSITLTGTRVGTGTATLTMYSVNGGVLPASKTDYMVVGTGMGTSDTSTTCSFVTIPDSHKYSNSFRIIISDDSTPNDGYAEIMIIQIKEPGSYPS